MGTFTGGAQYDITSVSFGIEDASSGSGSQQVIVNLYANNGAAFPAGYPASLTLLASAPVSVPDKSAMILTVPIVASVPAGTLELVMEVHSPDGTAGGNAFFIGSNSAGQSAPSYLSAAICGATTPTDIASLGFPDMHIVFNVNGSCASPTPTPTPCPTMEAHVTASPTTVRTNGNATFNVSVIHGPAPCPITVYYSMSGTGILGSDYTLSGTPGQVSIPAGQSLGAVTLHANNPHAQTVTAIMNLTSGSGYVLSNKVRFRKATISIRR
jgi:hypothetical protein